MKRKLSNYHQVVSLLRSICPSQWILLFESFDSLELGIRKHGILLFRSRHFPSDNSTTLYRLTSKFINWISRNVDDGIDTVRTLLELPDLAAITLSLLLSAPYPLEDVHRIFSDMVTKEMTAMESEARVPSIRWQNLLSLENTLHPDFRPSPNTNRYFRGMINRWRSRLSRSVIFPFSSTRSLSRDTLRRFNEITDNNFESICPLQLEQYYCETGLRIGGVCEMRQVWYPTISTPRTYYAMGGEAYFRSRYIRDIFNYLGDYLPATNRYTRVEPSHLTVEKDESTFVYDLTSFTSLFHEQRYFLDFIADCVEDLEVEIFDSHVGIRTANLGDMIREYNVLNKQPEYSLERMGIPLVLQHSVAGFLGVYANLITCTIPHGLCLMTLRDQKMKQWCAGDDAGTLYKDDDDAFDQDCSNTLETIGVLQQEKVFRDNEIDPAVALKRRLIRLPQLLTLDPNILFPPFATLFEGDPRFASREMGMDFVDHLSRFCSGLSSMMYQLSLNQFSEVDISFLRLFLPHLYTYLGLPPEGWFPPLCGYDSCPSGYPLSFTVPRILGVFWRLDPTKALLDAYMPNLFHGKVYAEEAWDGIVHDEFICNSSRILRQAVKMGFLDMEYVRVTYQLEEDVISSVYREYLKTEVDSNIALCRFVKLGDNPIWLR